MKSGQHALPKYTAFVGAATLLLSLVATVGHAQEEEEPLLPEQAFPARISEVTDSHITIQWDIAKRYYMYRSKFLFSAMDKAVRLGQPILPAGKMKQDEFFGNVAVYRGPTTISIPYTVTSPGPDRFTLVATSQGCADLGICYPPYKQKLTVLLPDEIIRNQPTDPITALSEFGQSLLSNDSGDTGFLRPDQAFKLTASINPSNQAVLDFSIAKGYYLYRDKIRVQLLNQSDDIRLGKLHLPDGEEKSDEFFGDTWVYYDQAHITLPVFNNTDLATNLSVTYQGCADAGLCYPPITKQLQLTTAAITQDQTPIQANITTQRPKLSEQDQIAWFLLNKPLWLSGLLFFGLGLLLTFTPCVFPMIPILSGIIAGQSQPVTNRQAFSLSLSYVLAMALTYTAVGIIAGLFGSNLQATFQDPIIISIFAGVFVLLSLSMFGFYELQMPQAIQSRLTAISRSQRGGTLSGVAIMGVCSAIIVGPCVSAPLLGALIVIGQTGDAVLGGIALFSLSMGMGTPLLIIGTSLGKFLPKSGAWMNTVKAIFGVGLLAVAIWLLERIIPGPVGLLLWAILFIVCAIYLGALNTNVHGGWQKLFQGSGIVLLVWGILMLIGFATGARDMLNPLKNIQGSTTTQDVAHLSFKQIKTVDDFSRELLLASSRGQFTMLDFYADWCVYCIQMEERTFSDPAVQKALAGVHLLRADVTANDDADVALLRQFNLIAPPAILFFDMTGKEHTAYRVVGFQRASTFLPHLDAVLQP